MLDISVVGDIFAAPAAPKVLEALKKADRPAGVLLVVLNHAGDVMQRQPGTGDGPQAGAQRADAAHA